ncbi:hypothetical protein FGO68_gene4889 [Halteria grandinella]|uniref:Uncharacterized protein n=1 Tax=Halteria grandinella TaxID=5974 RepID=A0A8J8ND18_HALGN|nr:hypothetical protein FGO68_gene4889 [Halteria grandinella]
MTFTQSDLDGFLQQIKDKGFSKLVDAALLHGLSVDHLSSKLTSSATITYSPFEGLTNRGIYTALPPGVYYGQHVNGLREGYGLLFTTQAGYPYLYECEWAKGMPIKGRQICIQNNEWYKYEGHFDQLYLYTGTGNWQCEDGHTYQGQWERHKRNGYGKATWPSGSSYQGEWKDDNMHGQGIYKWANGDSYDGQWQNNNRHGQGRFTYPSGEYEEGQWKDDKKVGEHKKYSKEGNAS